MSFPIVGLATSIVGAIADHNEWGGEDLGKALMLGGAVIGLAGPKVFGAPDTINSAKTATDVMAPATETTALASTPQADPGLISGGGADVMAEAAAGGENFAADIAAGDAARASSDANLFGSPSTNNLMSIDGMSVNMPAAAEPGLLSQDIVAGAGRGASPYLLPAAVIGGPMISGWAAGREKDRERKEAERKNYYGYSRSGDRTRVRSGDRITTSANRNFRGR